MQKLTEERMKEVEKELKIVDNELARSVPTLEQLKKQIDTRAKKIAKLNTKIHQREDELFATFCEAVGVANIREFEEKRLQDAKRATERRLHFSSLKSKLQHQYGSLLVHASTHASMLTDLIGFSDWSTSDRATLPRTCSARRQRCNKPKRLWRYDRGSHSSNQSG